MSDKEMRDLDLEYLMMQRNLLDKNMGKMTDNLHKATITFIAGAGTFGVVVFNDTNMATITPVGLFVILELLLLLAMYIFTMQLSSDGDKQKITAIDKYINEKRNVNTLFYSEASAQEKKFTFSNPNRFFVAQIVLIAFVAFTLITGILAGKEIASKLFDKENIAYGIIVVVELILFLSILVVYAAQGRKGERPIEAEALAYLHGDIQKPEGEKGN